MRVTACLLLFALIGLALDGWTTVTGLEKGVAYELNPNIDTSSFFSVIRPGLILLGVLTVIAAYVTQMHDKMIRQYLDKNDSFAFFRDALSLKPKKRVLYLAILLPFVAIAFSRLTTAASNLLVINGQPSLASVLSEPLNLGITGASLIVRIAAAAVGLAVAYPVIKFLYRKLGG